MSNLPQVKKKEECPFCLEIKEVEGSFESNLERNSSGISCNLCKSKLKKCPFCEIPTKVEASFEFKLETNWNYNGAGCNLCGAEIYESCELIRDPDEPGVFFF